MKPIPNIDRLQATFDAPQEVDLVSGDKVDPTPVKPTPRECTEACKKDMLKKGWRNGPALYVFCSGKCGYAKS